MFSFSLLLSSRKGKTYFPPPLFKERELYLSIQEIWEKLPPPYKNTWSQLQAVDNFSVPPPLYEEKSTSPPPIRNPKELAPFPGSDFLLGLTREFGLFRGAFVTLWYCHRASAVTFQYLSPVGIPFLV